MKNILTPWIGIPADLRLEDYEGFIYCVENTLTKQKYVGKKSFWARTRKKVKGRRKRKLTVKESTWRYYKSSSDALKNDISRLGLDVFVFSVLSFHRSKAELNYAEVKEQFLRDVLYSKLQSGDYEYLNLCILNRYYRKKDLT